MKDSCRTVLPSRHLAYLGITGRKSKSFGFAKPSISNGGLFFLLSRHVVAILVLAGMGLGLPLATMAQTCTPSATVDWMVTPNPNAQDIRPPDCVTVQQTPPDFRWPDVITSGGYQVTLTYPDGHIRTLPATQNWLNWDEVLPAGIYSWAVSYVGGAASKQRRFIVDSSSMPFLVPKISNVLRAVSAKAHPRSLPDATTLATMKAQRSAAVNTLLNDVSGRFGNPLPTPGTTADQAFTYSTNALAAMMACVYSNQDTYCNEAIRRVTNLASWDPSGPTAYSNSGMGEAARYLTWTVAFGYDWLYPRLTSTQRSRIRNTLVTRIGAMYNDVIGTRSRLATYPRDLYGNQTLGITAVVSTLVAGDLKQASTWVTNSLPLALNAISPWGGDQGGSAGSTAQGNRDNGELLPLWNALKYATGINVTQKAWVRNWGRFFTYFTPPGMAGGTTVFGDGFEKNDTELQARFGKAYTYFAPTPLGRWHMSLLSGEDQTRIEYLMAPPADFSGPQPFPAGTPNSLYVGSLGEVAMHSDLSNTARTSVYFKSSRPPYGAFSHSHADQNSFVINAGGQRLAIESGYYDGYKTTHWMNWYHPTRSSNAITYDGGLGQLFYEANRTQGYGKITGFSSSAAYDIVSGDATSAYGGALTLARRSLLYLRPNLILVYDNVASATNRQWEWNIHSINQMTSASDKTATIQNNGQSLCVTMLGGPAMHFTQTNQFTANPTGTWAPQWHGKFYSTTRLPAAEFVALMNVGCTAVTASATNTSGVWTVLIGDKTVTVDSGGAITVATATTATAAAATSTTTTTTTTKATTTTTAAPTTTTTTAAPTTTTTVATTTTTTLLLTASAPPPATSLPSTNTKAITTFESIGLYWTPPSNPGSAGCPIRYQKVGDTAWKNGLPMWYDARNNECRGSLVQLSPGTSYVVQFSLPGQAPSAQVSATTWSNNFPVAKTVYLPNGTSSKTLAITAGGTASGYVLYTFPAGGQSTIDVANAQTYNITVSAPYVIIRELILKGAQADAIRLLPGAHDVVIEGNDISGWGRFSSTTSEGNIGVDMDAAVRARCYDQTLVRLIVQRNRIHDPRYTTNSWALGHPVGPNGIATENCGGNMVIRYNEIYAGPSGHYYMDGIGGASNFSTIGMPNADSDIYGNLIQNAMDDGIEAEGGDRNVRIWGNYINQTGTGIASTVDSVGPLYIFRNVYNRSRFNYEVSLDSDTRGPFAKSGSKDATIGGGRRYLFHNTLLQATQTGVVYGLGTGSAITSAGLAITNTVTRNNIFQIWTSSKTLFQASGGSANDFGYDLYNSTNMGGAAETNGIYGLPTYASGNGWTSESGGMYQLAPNSLGYDRGVRLPNFNDSYLGAGPDIGAAEAGAPAMQFGVKAYVTAP
ncbi:protein of unknown function [Georgfuchsia toluolica]|uniref:Uncharacterized protein n=2 Tax=Georgfuchsia toluolica TaxID=424218 RepID=A0A916J2T8_9PROT|nr:protein of unknown function [Georgfuchsia toluolica]